MIWKIITRNLFYPLAILLAATLWLLTTNSGCKASFWVIKAVTPGELKIEKIKGTWISKLTLKDIAFENARIQITAEETIFEPDIFNLFNLEVKIPFINIKNALLTLKDKPDFPLTIEKAAGKFAMQFNKNNVDLNIHQVTGNWFNLPLQGYAQINIKDQQLQEPSILLTLGENKISIAKSEWSININTPKNIKANLNGNFFVNPTNIKSWIGQISKADFSTNAIGTWRLKEPTAFNFSPANLTIKTLAFRNIATHVEVKSDFHLDSHGLNANLDMAALFLPKQAITPRNLHLNISGKISEPLKLSGSGYSGDGKFNIDGTLQFNQKNIVSIKLIGKNLQIYNTRNMQIKASPELTIDYNTERLFVQGRLQINKAYIGVQDQKNVTLLSKDVVLTQSAESGKTTTNFRIITNIYVIIDNQLHFEGYGIDGIVGGKLLIEERPDGLLTGKGKLTIKEGKYRLQGATRYINRGYLLFPPGTLLKDPLLDILISQHRGGRQASTSDNVGIYVQGTLQHPIYNPYSNDSNLRSNEILSRLGFGQNETSGDESQKQLLAQSALLFSGTANPFIEFLQKNLQLEEFNLESKPTNKTYYTQGGADTVLVIGKSLSEKLYLQYLQSIMEPISTIRLKYFLSRYFTASAETGTEGVGGDLTFSMERD